MSRITLDLSLETDKRLNEIVAKRGITKAEALNALKSAECDRIFTDTATGATTKRSELQRCMKSLKSGDTLIVWKLDRLGRSLGHLITFLDSLKEGY